MIHDNSGSRSSCNKPLKNAVRRVFRNNVKMKGFQVTAPLGASPIGLQRKFLRCIYFAKLVNRQISKRAQFHQIPMRSATFQA